MFWASFNRFWANTWKPEVGILEKLHKRLMYFFSSLSVGDSKEIQSLLEDD